MLDKEKVKSIYADRLLSRQPLIYADDVPILYIQHYLPKNKNCRILDAGCGNGNYAYKLVNDGYTNLDAVDLFESLGSNTFRYKQASIDNLPFDNATMDFIYCNSVLFYLPDIEKGIIEFNRVLNRGGIAFITAHTKYSLFTLWRIIKRAIFPASMTHLKGVPFYTAARYSSWLEQNGFKVIKIDGYRLSIFFIPAWKKLARVCTRYLGIELPLPKVKMTRTDFMARIKSIFGYHSIVVAKKIRDI